MILIGLQRQSGCGGQEEDDTPAGIRTLALEFILRKKAPGTKWMVSMPSSSPSQDGEHGDEFHNHNTRFLSCLVRETNLSEIYRNGNIKWKIS
jgi:hypothetical protein